MNNLWLSILKKLGLAYWLTVTVDGQEQNSYCFGPFSTAAAALSAQDRCCRSLFAPKFGATGIIHTRISMEP